MFLGTVIIPVEQNGCQLCHKQNTAVVIPNGGKVKDISEQLRVWQQVQHQNSEAEFYLYKYTYFTDW